MTETDAQISAERWIIDACRDFKLPAESSEDDFFSIGGTFGSVTSSGGQFTVGYSGTSCTATAA